MAPPRGREAQEGRVGGVGEVPDQVEDLTVLGDERPHARVLDGRRPQALGGGGAWHESSWTCISKE